MTGAALVALLQLARAVTAVREHTARRLDLHPRDAGLTLSEVVVLGFALLIFVGVLQAIASSHSP